MDKDIKDIIRILSRVHCPSTTFSNEENKILKKWRRELDKDEGTKK